MKTVTEAMPKKQIKNLDRALDKEFNQALENPTFQELVSKLQMDANILRSYTSSLQDSAEEYEHCKECTVNLYAHQQLCSSLLGGACTEAQQCGIGGNTDGTDGVKTQFLCEHNTDGNNCYQSV